ncbi:MAG: hypothetical protein K2X29_00980 [Candidatus Obscuribacterales bacterium]|nr:hypothetical protein [Candidatus Obscuribacterales bacterium]
MTTKKNNSWLTARDKWKLADGAILKSICLESDRIYAYRSGTSSRLAVLDIDTGGRYHNISSIKALHAVLDDHELRGHVIYRSSESGGYHLHVPFEIPIDCKTLHYVFTHLLQYRGFVIQNGHLEVFPNPGRHSSGFGLRLPLQFGWAFLNQKTLQVQHERTELSALDAIKYFVDDLSENSNPPSVITKAMKYIALREAHRGQSWDISNAVNDDMQLPKFSRELKNTGGDGKHHKPYNKMSTKCSTAFAASPQSLVQCDVSSIWGDRLPSGMNWERWLHGREFYETGLTGPNQRSTATFSMQHYLFYGDPSRNIDPLGYGFEEDRADAIKSWLATSHNGFSKDINQDKPDAFKQIERQAQYKPGDRRGKNIVPFDSPYKRANDRRSQQSVDQILNWVEKLKDTGVKSQNQLHIVSGIAKGTLKKYKHLWAHLMGVWKTCNPRQG